MDDRLQRCKLVLQEALQRLSAYRRAQSSSSPQFHALLPSMPRPPRLGELFRHNAREHGTPSPRRGRFRNDIFPSVRDGLPISPHAEPPPPSAFTAAPRGQALCPFCKMAPVFSTVRPHAVAMGGHWGRFRTYP